MNKHKLISVFLIAFYAFLVPILASNIFDYFRPDIPTIQFTVLETWLCGIVVLIFSFVIVFAILLAVVLAFVVLIHIIISSFLTFIEFIEWLKK